MGRRTTDSTRVLACILQEGVQPSQERRTTHAAGMPHAWGSYSSLGEGLLVGSLLRHIYCRTGTEALQPDDVAH